MHLPPPPGLVHGLVLWRHARMRADAGTPYDVVGTLSRPQHRRIRCRSAHVGKRDVGECDVCVGGLSSSRQSLRHGSARGGAARAKGYVSAHVQLSQARHQPPAVTSVRQAEPGPIVAPGSRVARNPRQRGILSQYCTHLSILSESTGALTKAGYVPPGRERDANSCKPLHRPRQGASPVDLLCLGKIWLNMWRARGCLRTGDARTRQGAKFEAFCARRPALDGRHARTLFICYHDVGMVKYCVLSGAPAPKPCSVIWCNTEIHRRHSSHSRDLERRSIH